MKYTNSNGIATPNRWIRLKITTCASTKMINVTVLLNKSSIPFSNVIYPDYPQKGFQDFCVLPIDCFSAHAHHAAL